MTEQKLPLLAHIVDPIRGRIHDYETQEQRQLKFQAAMVANMANAVIGIDPGFRVSYCNASAERMYGIRSSEVVGKPLAAISEFSCLSLKLEEALCPKSAAKGLFELLENGSWTGENSELREDGSSFTVSCSLTPLPLEFGGGMVAVICDISESKGKELQMQQNNARLARANEELLHFVYAVGHDLDTPLRTVMALSQLLHLKHRAGLDGNGQQLITLIVEAGSRMEMMFHNLLEFAKLAGGDAGSDEVADLEECLAAALKNLGSGIVENSPIITHDTLPVTTGNELQLTRLFQNLIGNALKYRKPEVQPKIHISAQARGTEWIVVVSDNGMGFEPEYTDSIFRVSRRLHGTEVAGAGMGLPICKRIVERLGGKMWATGWPGKGAEFYFTLPAITSLARIGRQETRAALCELP